MVKLFPWIMTLNIDGVPRKIELSLEVTDIGHKKPYEAMLRIKGAEPDIDFINIEMPLGQDPDWVESLNPDDLKRVSKRNSKRLVDLFIETVRAAQLPEGLEVKRENDLAIECIRNIVKVKEDSAYDKARIISYMERVLEKLGG